MDVLRFVALFVFSLDFLLFLNKTNKQTNKQKMSTKGGGIAASMSASASAIASGAASRRRGLAQSTTIVPPEGNDQLVADDLLRGNGNESQ